MLPIAGLKRMTIGEVDPGTLLLYRHGREWLRALKVVGPGEDDNERQALIVMPFRARNGALAPVLFREIGYETCIVLGKPVAWWSGDPSTIVPGSEIERRPGYLQIRPDGITVVVETLESYRSIAAWRIMDGQVSRIASEYPYVTEWFIGIIDSEGKPVPFVCFPKDFTPGEENTYERSA